MTCARQVHVIILPPNGHCDVMNRKPKYNVVFLHLCGVTTTQGILVNTLIKTKNNCGILTRTPSGQRRHGKQADLFPNAALQRAVAFGDMRVIAAIG